MWSYFLAMERLVQGHPIETVGLAVAIWQLYEGRRAALKSAAYASYQAYLGLAVQFPELAAGHVNVESHRDQSREAEQYRWFLANLLMAAEQILRAFRVRDRAAWRDTLKIQLRFHAGTLRRVLSRKVIETYDRAVQTLIDDVCDETDARGGAGVQSAIRKPCGTHAAPSNSSTMEQVPC